MNLLQPRARPAAGFPGKLSPVTLHLRFTNLEEKRSLNTGRKKSSGAEHRANHLPPQSSSFSRGASSHVAASLFRFQDRIVRIVCIRAQLLASLPLPARDTHLRTTNPQFTDNGFYNLMIPPPAVGWSREYSQSVYRQDERVYRHTAVQQWITTSFQSRNTRKSAGDFRGYWVLWAALWQSPPLRPLEDKLTS